MAMATLETITPAQHELTLARRELTASDILAMEAAETRVEFAPGRVNSGRQASFDAVSAWNAAGSID